MKLYEQIRREHEFGVGTIAGVSRKLGVHRRMVRDALRSAEPAAAKAQRRRLRKLEPVLDFIDQILRADQSAPPKQRHTARRIFVRLCAEVEGFSGKERTVRSYVRRRRRELGLEVREVFIPQTYTWGSEAQVDWYEAWAMLGGERVKLQVFAMRSMASGAAFHRAYTHATQQAFLEAHQYAFHYFGGVFHTLRYDNLKSAVNRSSCSAIAILQHSAPPRYMIENTRYCMSRIWGDGGRLRPCWFITPQTLVIPR